jgi:hypothetical protein
MFVHWNYWMWTRGRFTVSHTIPLDRGRYEARRPGGGTGA